MQDEGGLPSSAEAAKLCAVTKAAHYPAITALAPAARLRAGRLCIFFVLLAGVLAGCGGRRETVRTPSPAPSAEWARNASTDTAASNSVLMRAISLVGTPYRYGGNTPQGGFDCSGLVNFVYDDMLAKKLPRTSTALAAYQGPRITPRQLATGDLVFFGSRGQVSHVGIYVGDGRFVHAPSSGGTVRLDRLDGAYWREHYSGATRVIN